MLAVRDTRSPWGYPTPSEWCDPAPKNPFHDLGASAPGKMAILSGFFWKVFPEHTLLHSPGPSRQWAGAFCYLASDASNTTTARAISETMTKRLMAVLLGLRRAQCRQSVKRSNRTVRLIAYSFPPRNARVNTAIGHQLRRNVNILRDFPSLRISTLF